jgi:hypothetical protein
MTFNVQTPVVGQPMANFAGLSDGTTTSAMYGGIIQSAVDPYWGGAEFVYARANGAIRTFGLCVLTPTFATDRYRYEATEATSTANLGRMICVAQEPMASGDFGWFQISGVVPVNCNAAVTAGTTFSVAAAGQGGAAAAGKQVLNAVITAASSTTVAKANCTSQGISTTLTVPNSDGWFVGAYLSGTGIGAAAIVNSISPDGRTVVMSVASTATITGTITATYNNATIFYNVAHINRPFMQGAIT